MALGFIGLGKMGLNMVRRLNLHGQATVCHDVNSSVASELDPIQNAKWAESIEKLLELLPAPRAIWLMVPAGRVTKDLVTELCQKLTAGDIIIDGGNSDYRNTRALAEVVSKAGLELVDAGTSGGIHGLKRGYCLMVGGSQDSISKLSPYFSALAPENGWKHVGPTGNGHLVKMVHNAIEYGMMQSMAEGFALLNKLDDQVNLGEVADLWNRNSVIESWLMELSASVFKNDEKLEQIKPFVQDSGEGRWALESAISNSVPTPVFAAALFARFSSRGEDEFGNKYLSALRNAFGGHAMKKED